MSPSEETSAKTIPEFLQKDLASILTTSKEILQTSKSLIQSPSKNDPSKRPSAILVDVGKLVGLINSHTVRTALTCGPTASSPATTLKCIKDLLQPILPLVSEVQSLSGGEEYPEYFTKGLRRDIGSLFDAIDSFLGEVVEISRGERSVGSAERLQYSGMVMEFCDRIQRDCKDGPMKLFQKKLLETEDMLKDALEELDNIINSSETVDEWGDPIEYTSDQKHLAERGLTKLRLLSLLYKALSKRRFSMLTYSNSLRSTLDVVHDHLVTLSGLVDDFASGVAGQEDPMTLELSLMQIVENGREVASAARKPLTGMEDGRETWFDTWRETMT
jgi:hypothetical protein